MILRATFLLPATMLLAGCEHPPGSQSEPPHPEAIAIGAVQGRGDRSPLEGQAVRIEGVITRSMAAPVRGAADEEPVGSWFVQDAGDGDQATPDTVFVRATTLTVEILSDEVTTRIGNTVRSGDRIAVYGKVVELPSLEAGDVVDDVDSTDAARAPSRTLTTVEALTVEVVAPGSAGP